MKFLQTVVAGLFVLAFTFVSVHAQDLGDAVTQQGVFSYQAPKGWTVKESPLSKYKVCLRPVKAQFAPNINVVIEAYDKSLDEYVAANIVLLKSQPILQNMQIIGQQPFEAAAGVKGVRVVAKDRVGTNDLQQTFYFLDGAPGSKVVVTATCLVADGDQLAPIFDASMKTFSPK